MTFLDFRLMRIAARLLRPLMPRVSAGLDEDVSDVLARSEVSRTRLRLVLLHAGGFWVALATVAMLAVFIVGMAGKLATGSAGVPMWLVNGVKGLGVVVIWCIFEALLLSLRERIVGAAGKVRNVRVPDDVVVARWRPRALDWCVPTLVVVVFVLLAHWY